MSPVSARRAAVYRSHLVLNHRLRRPHRWAANDNRSEARQVGTATLAAAAVALVCTLTATAALFPA